jgi:hypothetical protein
MGAPRVAQPFPFFKESETNQKCCGCGDNQLKVITPQQAATTATREIHDFGTHVVQTDTKRRTDLFEHPKQIGDSYYNHPTGIAKQFAENTPNYKIGERN